MKCSPGIILLLFSVASMAQTASPDHHAGVVQRGESHAGMGFSQSTTTHHFILTENGGIVQVTANDAANTEQIQTIQNHLTHVAEMFSQGNFSIPHFVHAQNPPGAATMKKLKSAIHYSAEPLSNGGRVKIESSSPEAIAAVHQFLRFQINDHQTGDALSVKRE